MAPIDDGYAQNRVVPRGNDVTYLLGVKQDGRYVPDSRKEFTQYPWTAAHGRPLPHVTASASATSLHTNP
ncbi:MAG: hypothetical protein ACJ8R9_19915 [Steroidobacteraceae bacterium]